MMKKTNIGKVHTLQKSEKQAYSRPTFVTTASTLEQLDMSYWSDIGLVNYFFEQKNLPAARLEKKTE
jgi:hypothetical protein